MKTKLVTRYDYFLATLITGCFVFTLLINRNLETILIASIILSLGIYKAFGKRITFSEDKVMVRTFIFKKRVNYGDILQVSYTTRLYGKSFLTVFSSSKKHRAPLQYRDWMKLKAWLAEKGIECVENR